MEWAIKGDLPIYSQLVDQVKQAIVAGVFQPGDTLSAIAYRFHTTWQEIARMNGLKDPNLIFPGQVLKIG